jgi:hypothetical protein
VSCRRVCGWRAKHAVSPGHWRAPLWLGLEPGRKLRASPRLAIMVRPYL